MRISHDLRCTNAAMRHLEEDVMCAIHCNARVMISGERGTGKKFVARRIHRWSRRAPRPFIIANCPDVVESLLPSSPGSESVDQFARGLNTADNGTLLIEEIQRLPMPAQPHLLRFIERDMTRTGCDVRLITATPVDLLERVRSNQFRYDLFYRLNVIHLMIPALRDRPEDIPILFRHYLSVYARTNVPQLSSAAWDRLSAYAWPGNVQELKAVSEKVAVLDLPRLVEPEDLPLRVGG